MKAVVKLRDCHSLLDLSDDGKIDVHKLPSPSKSDVKLFGVRKCVVRLKKINLNNIKDIIEQSKRRKKAKGRPRKHSHESSSYKKQLKRSRTNSESDTEIESVAKKRRVHTQNDTHSSKFANGKKKKLSKELLNNVQKKSNAIYFRLPESNQFKKIRETINAPAKKGRPRKADEPEWKKYSPRLFRSIIRLPRVKLEDAERLMKPKKSVSFLEAVRVFGETDDEEDYYGEEETTELDEEEDGVVNGHVEDDDNLVEGKRCLSPSARKMLENRCSTPIKSRIPDANIPSVKKLISPASKKMYETTNVIDLASTEDSNSSADEADDTQENVQEEITKTPDKKETYGNSDESFVTADEEKSGNENSTDVELSQIKETSETTGILSNTDSESAQNNIDKTSLNNGQINDNKDSEAGEEVAQNDQKSNDSMPALYTADKEKDVETNDLDSPNTKTVFTHNNNVKKTVESPEVLINSDQEVDLISLDGDDDASTKDAIGSNTVEVDNRKNFFEIDQSNISAACLEIAKGEQNDSSTNNKLNISSQNDVIALDNDEISTTSEKFNLTINKEYNDKNNENSLEKVFNTELNSIKQNCENHLDNPNNDCIDVTDDLGNSGGYVSTFERQMSFDDLMNEQTGKVSSISDAIINNDAIMGSPQMIGDDDSNSLLPAAVVNNIPTSISLESQDSENLDGPLKLSASDENDDLSGMNDINKALCMDPSELVDDCDQNKSASSSKASEPSSFSFSFIKTIKNKFFPQPDKSVAENSMNSNDKFSDLDGDNILDLLNINDDELLETNLNDVSLVATKSDSLLDDDILCNTEYSISK